VEDEEDEHDAEKVKTSLKNYFYKIEENVV